eukprot:TRINITY_DN3762_c0_g2_i1.p4 TRINITY_DN3762_c0_g2~~TRINITY_DN3762_c0_g2_i1.p4  ORF type:complete len:116 (-),score=26.51 TRINITY_DN3762_c0_g2_i1:77-424(-)
MCIRDRYMGFAILLVDTPAEAAATVIERLLATIRSKPASHPESGQPIAITASIGCTESKAEDDEQSPFVRADRALYAAKQGGRDQHCWRQPATLQNDLGTQLDHPVAGNLEEGGG